MHSHTQDACSKIQVAEGENMLAFAIEVNGADTSQGRRTDFGFANNFERTSYGTIKSITLTE